MRWLNGITDLMDMCLNKTIGAGDGQAGLAYYSVRGHKESDMTELLS